MIRELQEDRKRLLISALKGRDDTSGVLVRADDLRLLIEAYDQRDAFAQAASVPSEEEGFRIVLHPSHTVDEHVKHANGTTKVLIKRARADG